MQITRNIILLCLLAFGLAAVGSAADIKIIAHSSVGASTVSVEELKGAEHSATERVHFGEANLIAAESAQPAPGA